MIATSTWYFLGHELFTFYGGEEKAVPEELVAVFEYPAKRTYEYEFESREGSDRGLAIRRFIRLKLLATKRECQIILAELRAKERCDEEFVKALHTWPEGWGGEPSKTLSQHRRWARRWI